MNLKIHKLKKYAPKIKIKKLPIYANLKKYDYIIKKYKIQVQDIDEIALENTIAYINSFINKERIDEIYFEIASNQYITQVLDFTSLNKVIELAILEKIDSMPHFYNPDLIVIPVFEQKLNYEFIYDYLRTNLKWEKSIWKSEINQMKNPIDQYGHYFYHFTDFKYINHTDDIYYYYLDDTKRIYLFNDTTKEFIDDFCIADQKYKGSFIDQNDLIEIVEYYVTENEDKLLQFLLAHEMISEKTFRKVNK